MKHTLLTFIKDVFRFIFISSGILKLYIKFLRKRRIELDKHWQEDEQISRLGLIETGLGEYKKKSDKELFPKSFPYKSLESINLPAYNYSDKYAYVIKNARLAGPFSLGIDTKGRIVNDTLSFTTHRFEDHVLESFRRMPAQMFSTVIPFKNFDLKKADVSLKTACVLNSWWNNYYHWTIEHLPKLRAAEIFENETGYKPSIIIPPNPPRFVFDTLRIMGYQDHEVIEWKNHCRIADVENLVVANFPEMTPETFSWLRKGVFKGAGVKPVPDGKRRIYISRADAYLRRIINEHEVEEFIAQYGFETHILSELSFIEQVRLFNEAEVVLAPHGAGLTNILWSNNVRIIEIFNNKLRPHYARISSVLGFDYDAIIAIPSGKRDMIVDVREIEKTFHRLKVGKRPVAL